MHKKVRIAFFVLIIIALASGCDGYNRVLKSKDVDLKREKAKEYYNEGKYYKALPLLDELISIYRGQPELEDIYYIYCYANYGQGNYISSAYHFKNFTTFYPNSDKREDAMYMVGKSYFNLAPPPELDQEYTQKALDAFQLFINTYPKSDKVADANAKMDVLHKRLEEKAYKSAMLYYKMGYYQSASVALENMIKDFPDTDKSEYVHYMIVKANYLYAKNSIPGKQQERYQRTVEAFKTFTALFPNSKYIKDASNYRDEASQALQNYPN